MDHIMVNRTLQDVRVTRGADANSDHCLVRAILKLKLRKAPKTVNTKKLDIARLNDPATRKAFNSEFKNRFSVYNMGQKTINLLKNSGITSKQCTTKLQKR